MITEARSRPAFWGLPILADKRRLWAAALIWCGLHLIGFLGAMLFLPEYTRDESRSWSDLVTYLDAADAIRHQTPLYELDGWEDVMAYHYHPAFATVLSPLAELPFRLVSILWLSLLVAAYLGAIWVWYRVLLPSPPDPLSQEQERGKQIGMRAAYLLWLPLVLLFSEWYANLMYGNIAGVLFFLSGLLSLYLVQEKPRHAGGIALLILLLKPQWLFPLLLLIIFRKWRFLLTLTAYVGVGYITVSGLFIGLMGTEYGIDTLRDYFKFLTVLNDVYPWTGKTLAFEDMNHSWRQIFLSYFGFQDWIPYASEGIKLLMAAGVGWLVLQAWRRRVEMRSELAFCFLGLSYLVAMAALAQLWELLAGIVFFLYLQSVESKTVRWLSRLFLVYVLYEVAAIVSFATGIEALFLPQSIPLTMLALLVLYFSLLVVTAQKINQSPVSAYLGR